MKKIIIDTNALLAIALFRVDVFSEIERACDFPYRLAVLQGTIRELESLAATENGKFTPAARLALALLKAKTIIVLKSTGKVDDALVAESKKGALILTQDKELKKRLQKPYLTIRQKKYVTLVHA
ncbi:DNA-binding protein [Candidatus Woesearchaeota archaeon]|nr:DNA-binding protein [Candidatus Woesearchaeota archaeon]